MLPTETSIHTTRDDDDRWPLNEVNNSYDRTHREKSAAAHEIPGNRVLLYMVDLLTQRREEEGFAKKRNWGIHNTLFIAGLVLFCVVMGRESELLWGYSGRLCGPDHYCLTRRILISCRRLLIMPFRIQKMRAEWK